VSGPPPANDDGAGRSRANLAALIAIVVLALLGYLAFNYIDQQRKLQNCLDSGRRDCAQLMSTGK
jgi:hypothetical protein